MKSITLQAPAKVNLLLRVGPRGVDGYHRLRTIFERIALFDTITLTRIPHGITLRSTRRITALSSDNLAYKAAALLLHHAGISAGVSIRIAKRIPLGAGLGGGSSDAAAVLVGINKLFRLKYSTRLLARIGRHLGADVPFFVHGMACGYGTGRGDRLKPLALSGPFWHLLVYPGFELSTREVYAAFDRMRVKRLTVPRPGGTIHLPLREPLDFGTAESILHNDLQGAAAAHQGVIRSMLQRLASSLGKKVIVSGSGPSVFCLYRHRQEALDARTMLRRKIPLCERKHWQLFVVSTW